MDRKTKKTWMKLIGGAAAVIIAGYILYWNWPVKTGSAEDLDQGTAYIQSLEQTDITVTENKIKEIKKKERKEALASGDIDVWQQFNDAAILGDSRAVGFYYYDFLDHSRVLAEGGATIRDIPGHIEELKNLNPSSIFLCYGLNDISIGYWDTVEQYIEELDAVLAQLHTELPNATVYVNSTIPAIDPAFERSSKWRNIPDWNVAVKAHCVENDIPYVDISETVEAHKEYYDVDGIHVDRGFYDYWAIDMITEIGENE